MFERRSMLRKIGPLCAIVWLVGCSKQFTVDAEPADLGVVEIGETIASILTTTSIGQRTIVVSGPFLSDASNCEVVLPESSESALSPGASREDAITLVPSAPGRFCATVAFRSADREEVLTELCGDTPPGPCLDCEPEIGISRDGTELADGAADPVDASGPVTYTITNSGDAPLTLDPPSILAAVNVFAEVTLTSAIVEAGTSTTLAVDIQPSGDAPHDWSFELAVGSNDADEGEYNLSITGDVEAPPPELLVASEVQLPSTPFGVPFSSLLELPNNGGPATIQSVTIQNPVNVAAAVSPTEAFPQVIAGGPGIPEFMTFDITPGLGAYSFQAVIFSDDPASPHTVLFLGEGLAPDGLPGPDIAVGAGPFEFQDGDTVDVGSQPAGQPNQLEFSVISAGSLPLDVSTLTLDDLVNVTASHANALPQSLLPAASIPLAIDFTPSSAGPWQIAVHIGNNSPGEDPFDLTFTGIAVGLPDIEIRHAGVPVASGGVLDVPGVVGMTQTLELEVHNLGLVPLTLGTAMLSDVVGATAVLTAPGGTVDPGVVAPLTIQLTPSADPYSVTLTVPSDDPDEDPYTFVISGGSVAPGGCMGLPEIVEMEPNETVPNDLTGGDAPLCFRGHTTCGDLFYLDQELFEIDFPTSGPRTFSLHWSAPGDFDLVVFEPPMFDVVIDFEFGFTGSESATATFDSGIVYHGEIGCFEPAGVDGDWFMLVQ